MASQSDQFFKEKFSKFLQEKDVDSDDEYDTEDNPNPSWNAPTSSLAGRLGIGGISLGRTHDEELDVDVPLSSRGIGGLGGLGGRTGGTLGGRAGMGGRSLGGLGGNSLGGRSIGGFGGNSRGGGMISRGGISQGAGLGGLGRGKTPQSVSSSDNLKPKTTDSKEIEDMSKALGEIAKGTTALQKEVAAFISDSQQKNVEAFKEILHFIHGLADKTVVSFKELSREEKHTSAHNGNYSDEKPVDEALQALISNIDKTLKESTNAVYVILPDKDSVDTSELSKLFGGKVVHITQDVHGLCDKIMSVNTEDKPEETDADTPADVPTTVHLPVQVSNITPTSASASPSKGFPPLRSPIK